MPFHLTSLPSLKIDADLLEPNFLPRPQENLPKDCYDDCCRCCQEDPPKEVPPPTGVEEKPLSSQEAFFKKYAPFAILTHRLTKIPASVTLAQAALESGYGKHAPGNNFFGIKGEGPAGSQLLKTREYRGGRWYRTKARFRKYNDPLESFLDHAKVISQGRYLRHAMEHTGSAQEFITALQSRKTRYATDPKYTSKIMSLIHQYDLEKYDLFLGE